jgi:signal transduction histidine kinase/CheY-like chemotaxis protein
MAELTKCAPTLRLLGSEALGPPGEVVLSRDVILLGRDPGCEIVLPSPEVSRRHARISRHSDGYYLEDVGSTGGTLLNDVPLQGAVCLKDGDLIKIGQFLIAFNDPGFENRPSDSEDASILGVRDVSGTQEHALAGIHSEEKLRALLEIGRNLVGTYDLKKVLEGTLSALFRIFAKAERGFVLLKQNSAGSLAPAAFKIRGGQSGRLTVSRTILEHVMLHGKAVLSDDVSTDDRFRGSQSLAEAQVRNLMCVPLQNHEREQVGILQLDTQDRKSPFTQDDLDVLVAVAGHLSVAIDNARLLERAEHERKRLGFLAEVGAVLARSLDPAATLASVARLAVPRLADLCTIELLDKHGSIQRVAAAHSDPAKQALVDELHLQYPPTAEEAHPAMRALRTGEPELANSVPDQFLANVARDDRHLSMLRRVGLTSYLMVPLVARGRKLGVLSLIGTEQARRFGEADLEMALELGRRAALAIDNAALYHEAEEARHRAEEAGRSKGLFLAMVSHELRTPLTPILAVISGRLERGSDPLSQSELEMIRRNVVLEARLIDDLLDLARIEGGRLQLNRHVIDLHRTIEQAVEICRDQIAEGNIALTLDLSARQHHVNAEQARLMQVAWNLIRNAAKFTPAGGTLTIRSRNQADRRQDSPPSLVVEFVDNGRGIDPQLLPRIFDAFEQGNADLRDRAGGLGLGLAISRLLVEAHGGCLSAQSAGTGLGSTFRLELPAVEFPAAELDRPPPISPAPLRSLHILLAEDNQDTLRFLALVLRQRGHEVRAVSSLSEARMEATSTRFDLVISDIELPDGSGLDLMRELSGRGVRGIAVSGFGSEDDVEQSRHAGFSEHLTKPVEIGKLEEVIGRVIAEGP